MLFDNEKYRKLQSFLCFYRWALTFIIVFTLDSRMYLNLDMFGDVMKVLAVLGGWSTIVYWVSKRTSDDERVRVWLGVIEWGVDLLLINYYLKAIDMYGDSTIYMLFLYLVVVAFAKYGNHWITYGLTIVGIGDMFYIHQEIFSHAYALKVQSFSLSLLCMVGVVFVMYYIFEEYDRMKMLAAVQRSDLRGLEDDVEQLTALNKVSTEIYQSNTNDLIIVNLLTNIQKMTKRSDIGLILYGENGVESDARMYNYIAIRSEKLAGSSHLPYETFYAQKEIQSVKESRSYKNCIRAYEPIVFDENQRALMHMILPGTTEKYIYLFNITKDNKEYGIVVCNVEERIPYEVCQHIDELARYTGVAMMKNQLLETERIKSMYDELTGVKSRRYIEESLPKFIKQAKTCQRPLGVMFLDIDHFKHVNDKYGHSMGDKVLQKISEIAQKRVPKDSLFGRYGGEEFIAVIYEGNEEKCYEIAEEIRTTIEQFPLEQLTGEEGTVTISIGIAVYPSYSEDFTLVIQGADEAMYQAKETRNAVCIKH